MGEEQARISVRLSTETKRRLDEFVLDSGHTRHAVIERALNSYLSSPDAALAACQVPTTLTLTNESYDRVVERMLHPEGPTPALAALLRGESGTDTAPEGF